MQDQLDKDLKAAMLGGDKQRAEVLRGLKNALQYEAVAQNSVDRSLDDEQIQKVLAREAKKRQEAADIYQKAGESERAEAELAEKMIIGQYLPGQLDESAILALVKDEIGKADNPSAQNMGQIIGAVKASAGASADGATIARLVKEALGTK
ncbi:GatB/YqeY domain-containing protein [Candidatus Saccharibacteria bacterium]|nr:GatB/YqeY domain-containing protein [Candidatus Saccharibacteria bacterium]